MLGLALLAFAPGRYCGAQIDLAPKKQDKVSDSVSNERKGRAIALSVTAATRAPISNGQTLPPDRKLLLVGLERRVPLAEGRIGSVSAGSAFLPAVYTTGNQRTELQPCGFFEVCPVAYRYAAFGIGVIPLSIRFESSPDSRFRLAAHAGGGGVWFTRRVPATSGTRFNFLAQFGLDCRFRITTRTWVEPGYRHVHISNGGTGELNPGVDISALVLGLSWS